MFVLLLLHLQLRLNVRTRLPRAGGVSRRFRRTSVRSVSVSISRRRQRRIRSNRTRHTIELPPSLVLGDAPTVPVIFDLSFRNTEIAFCNFCLSAVSNISCLAKSGCNFSSKNCSFVNFRKVSEYFCSPNRWSHLVDEKREREKRKETMRHARSCERKK